MKREREGAVREKERGGQRNRGQKERGDKRERGGQGERWQRERGRGTGRGAQREKERVGQR